MTKEEILKQDLIDRGYMSTYSGKFVNPLNLKESDIESDDIAHHLALQNRFAGASGVPYNVAQHSVEVMLLVSERGGTLLEKQLAILHDAPEAYLGDWITPFKHLTTISGIPYSTIEHAALNVILVRYGLSPISKLPEIVKTADRDVLHAEARGLLVAGPHWATEPPEDVLSVTKATVWPWKISKNAFLSTMERLGLK